MGGSRLEHCSDVNVLTLPPDPLTNASYVRELDSGWSLLLPFLVYLMSSLPSSSLVATSRRVGVSPSLIPR